MTRLLLAALCTCLALVAPAGRAAEAVFAGGCFWCMEADFEKLEGVGEVVSGFTGGTLPNPTYRSNHEGHYEAVKGNYDPAVGAYEELLEHFWHNIDPFDARGQFCDKGPSYRTAIFATDAQRSAAQASLTAVRERFPEREIATELLPASRFWPVEAYHQNYADNNPLRYKLYRWNCGRDGRLEEVWGEDAQ